MSALISYAVAVTGFVAGVTAGVGAAGLALTARRLNRRRRSRR